MGSQRQMSESERAQVWRRQRLVLCVVAGAGLVFLTGFVWRFLVPAVVLETKRMVVRKNTGAAHPTELSASRPVYPYSIIRGGAYSKTELIEALETDSVAARHYSTFHRPGVYITQSTFTEPVYLSYRVGDAVYWTSRPVRLPKGETLLTDGQNYARARCGNRISPVPQTPVNDTEPAPETMDSPQRPANTIADLSTWTENRLLTLETPLIALSPAQPIPLSAVPTVVTPVESTPAWWTPGFPGGLPVPLIGEIPLTLLPPTSPPVIQPNPIPDLIPPIIPPLPLPPPPSTVLAIIPPYVFPPYAWPPTPTIPIIPGLNPTPITPTSEVPEPTLLPAILLACVGLGVARHRLKR